MVKVKSDTSSDSESDDQRKGEKLPSKQKLNINKLLMQAANLTNKKQFLHKGLQDLNTKVGSILKKPNLKESDNSDSHSESSDEEQSSPSKKVSFKPNTSLTSNKSALGKRNTETSSSSDEELPSLNISKIKQLVLAKEGDETSDTTDSEDSSNENSKQQKNPSTASRNVSVTNRPIKREQVSDTESDSSSSKSKLTSNANIINGRVPHSEDSESDSTDSDGSSVKSNVNKKIIKTDLLQKNKNKKPSAQKDPGSHVATGPKNITKHSKQSPLKNNLNVKSNDSNSDDSSSDEDSNKKSVPIKKVIKKEPSPKKAQGNKVQQSSSSSSSESSDEEKLNNKVQSIKKESSSESDTSDNNKKTPNTKKSHSRPSSVRKDSSSDEESSNDDDGKTRRNKQDSESSSSEDNDNTDKVNILQNICLKSSPTDIDAKVRQQYSNAKKIEVADVLSDLSDSDEIYLLQTPKNVSLAESQVLDFAGKHKLKIAHEKFVTKPMNKLDSNLLVSNRPKSVRFEGHYKLQKYVKSRDKVDLEVPKKSNVPLPDKLKSRHPLFGAEYNNKIHLDALIEQKLKEAIDNVAKAEKKKKRKKRKKSETEEKPLIFDLLNNHNSLIDIKKEKFDDDITNNINNLLNNVNPYGLKIDIKKEKYDEEDTVDNSMKNVKKKKKKTSRENSKDTLMEAIMNISNNNCMKKKKKEKVVKENEENSSSKSNIINNLLSETMNQHMEGKKTKKKKNKSFEESVTPKDTSINKKSKKKKDKHENQIENVDTFVKSSSESKNRPSILNSTLKADLFKSPKFNAEMSRINGETPVVHKSKKQKSAVKLELESSSPKKNKKNKEKRDDINDILTQDLLSNILNSVKTELGSLSEDKKKRSHSISEEQGISVKKKKKNKV